MQLVCAPQIWALLICGCGRYAAMKGHVRWLQPSDKATDLIHGQRSPIKVREAALSTKLGFQLHLYPCSTEPPSISDFCRRMKTSVM